MTLAAGLITASAAIVLLLGAAHLVLTFFTRAFSPRDELLEARLKAVSPRLTPQTTLWRSQIGFHASHSLGLMLFGAVYAYLALLQRQLFFQSGFLMTLGGVVLLSYLVLARVYWFKRPFQAVLVALALYAAGIVAA